MLKRLIIVISLIIFALPSANAKNALIIAEESKQVYELNGFLSIWEVEAPRGTYLDEAVINFIDGNFEEISGNVINYGFSGRYVWVRLAIANETPHGKLLMLRVRNPLFNEIDFYQVRKNILIKNIRTGDKYKYSSRDKNYTDFVFEIKIPSKSIDEIYVRLNSDGEALVAPFELVEYESLIEINSKSKIIKSVFYGLMLFVICFNFFLLILNKQKLYLYYNLFIIFLTVFIFGVDGLLFKFVFPNHPFFTNQIIVSAGAFANFFLLILTRYFWQITTDKFEQNKIIPFFLIFAGLLGVFAFMGNPIFYIIYLITFFISFIFPVYILWVSLRNFSLKDKSSLYFISGFIFFIIGIILFILKNTGVLLVDYSGVFFLKLGVSLLIIILTLAITESFKKLRDNAKLELQQLVDLRTKEVKKQNEDMLRRANVIEKSNKELEKLSIVARETENGVTVSDLQGNILFQNRGFESLYGYSYNTRFANRQAKLQELIDNVDVEFEMNKSISLNKSVVFENPIELGSKIIKWVQTTITPISDTDGNMKYLAVLDVDITYSKRTEEKLVNKNLNITQSIKTAKNIQDAILPLDHVRARLLPESFVFFRPKDIVSGDFYWLDRKGGKVLIAAIDCTGHGVPGALMSLVAFIELTKATKEKQLTKPSEILTSLNNEVNESLKITNEDHSVKEGLVISLCSINLKTRELIFSGAQNPLYLVRDKQLLEFKAERFPIGIYYGERQKVFKDTVIDIQEGDCIYLFSDGFADQFGGVKNRKYLLRRFKNMLVEINDKSMDEQGRYLEHEFYTWKGKNEQIDDVLVIGIKI